MLTSKHFMSKTLNFIKFQKIHEFFSNLKAMTFYNSNLREISADDLKPFPELIYFGSWGNKLRTIPGNLFVSNSDLRYVSFYNNSITSVGSNFLKSLTKLQYIDFLYNSCINADASSNEAISQLEQKIFENCNFDTMK